MTSGTQPHASFKTCFSFRFTAVAHRYKVDVISSFLHLKHCKVCLNSCPFCLNLLSSQAEYQLQERYFDALVKKEQMEEKMKGIREMKCRAVTCAKVLS